MAKYRKKPVIVDAFKWTGGPDQTEDPEWIIAALKKDFFNELGAARIIRPNPDGPIMMEIFSLEDRMIAMQGDYIIKGIEGEIYSCNPDVFEQTYELVEE